MCLNTIFINIIKERTVEGFFYKAETVEPNQNISDQNFINFLYKLESLIEKIEGPGCIIQFKMDTSCFAIVDCDTDECVSVDRSSLEPYEIEQIRKLLFGFYTLNCS